MYNLCDFHFCSVTSKNDHFVEISPTTHIVTLFSVFASEKNYHSKKNGIYTVIFGMESGLSFTGMYVHLLCFCQNITVT